MKVIASFQPFGGPPWGVCEAVNVRPGQTMDDPDPQIGHYKRSTQMDHPVEKKGKEQQNALRPTTVDVWISGECSLPFSSC